MGLCGGLAPAVNTLEVTGLLALREVTGRCPCQITPDKAVRQTVPVHPAHCPGARGLRKGWARSPRLPRRPAAQRAGEQGWRGGLSGGRRS